MLRNYPYIGGEDIPNYSKRATWILLNAYIDVISQRLIDEYPGNGVQAIKILHYPCANTTFYDQSIYNRLFQKLIDKEGESEINSIKKEHNDKTLEISVVNSYFENQVMHTSLDFFHKCGKTLFK